MNTTTLWDWLKALPYGTEIRRYTPPGPYIQYRHSTRLTIFCWIPAFVLELFFSPLPHAPIAARIGFVASLAVGIGIWIAASIRYVLAWDELQRRALAESGAIAALIMIGLLGLYTFFERLFRLPHATTMVWFVLGAAIWFIALPLIRRHYES
jgi:hypothetical protein